MAAAAVAGTDAIGGKADPAAALIHAIRTAALPHPAGLLLSAGLRAGGRAQGQRRRLRAVAKKLRQ